ncbi:hypothetical protein [Ruminococcus sp. YE78]|uniref:hypothetical protein n=1 Tax=Ruminococcus sp. YE78 TaxID=1352374 RepID=UPI0008843338|nr:hypothetical protein [Ruminococcus sp. YE78]SDA28040.1 hypothetical protein SAMN02910446_02901 [Ruminococcus sp. YE78]
MARKADIKNLIKEAERKDQRVIEIEKMLEAAKNDSVGAWDKVSARRNELEQENNNGLAAVVKEVFWNDITPEELIMKWDELLLINEVKEYIESERAKHIAVIDNNVTNDNNIDQADNTEDTDSE